MVKYNNKDYTGAELLKKYRATEIKSFLYKHYLLSEIEDFTMSFHDFPINTFFVFLNDSGKYIVFNNYNKMEFSDEFIRSFCRKYNVSYEGLTREIHEDDEGNKSMGMITYIFEIIK